MGFSFKCCRFFYVILSAFDISVSDANFMCNLCVATFSNWLEYIWMYAISNFVFTFLAVQFLPSDFAKKFSLCNENENGAIILRYARILLIALWVAMGTVPCLLFIFVRVSRVGGLYDIVLVLNLKSDSEVALVRDKCNCKNSLNMIYTMKTIVYSRSVERAVTANFIKISSIFSSSSGLWSALALIILVTFLTSSIVNFSPSCSQRSKQ